MYHQGRSTVLGHVGATGAEGLLDWPKIQRETWAAAAQQAFEEGRADGSGSSYPLLDILYPYLLSDELKRYAMLSGQHAPLVWRDSYGAVIAPDAQGAAIKKLPGSHADVNPDWIFELIDMAKGMAEIEKYLDLFNNAGGPAALAGSYAITKWPGEITKNVAKVKEIALQMWRGVENTRAGGLAEAQRRAREFGADKTGLAQYVTAIGAALKETTTQAKEQYVDPVLDELDELSKKAADAVKAMEWADIMKIAIPVGIGGIILYTLAAKKRR